MPTITLNFDHDINESLQCAPCPNPQTCGSDDVYYCPNETHGGFDTVDNENLSNTGIVYIGKCTLIDRDVNTIDVLVDPSLSVPQQIAIYEGVGLGDFIMFSKSNQANLSSLLGYYAEATLVNNSPYEAELFAVSTEVSESSK
jgi:hypothetical protein